MSELEKLSIIGIRSFSPKSDNNQIVTFSSPLTLILGENGAGKTTIIECLKYVITGSQPPNTKSGAAFIHDPKLANSSEVKARVKLQFKDAKRRSCIVQRAMALYQKKVKVEYKNLEGLISIQDHDGKTTSMSTRCGELDQEMTYLLGVSKPILANVIFCHQEDSNWPLSEGKVLKSKFDDIFASSKFVKALDHLKKIKTSKSTLIRELEIETKYLNGNRKKKQTLTFECNELLKKNSELREKYDNIQNELDPLEHKLSNLNRDLKTLYDLRNEQTNTQVKIDHLNLYISDLRSRHNFDDIYESDEDLERNIKDYTNCQEKFREMFENLNNVYQELIKSRELLLAEQNQLLSYESKATNLKELLDSHMTDLKEIQNSLEEELQIKSSENVEEKSLSQISDEIMENIQKEINNYALDCKTKKESLLEEISAKNQEIDILKTNKSKNEILISMYESQIVDLDSQKNKLVSSIENFEDNKENCMLIKSKISSLEHKLKVIKENFDPDKILLNIEDQDHKISELNDQVSILDEKIRITNENKILKNKIDLLVEKKSECQNYIDNIIMKYSKSINEFFGKSDIDQYSTICRSELRNTSILLERAQSECDDLRKHSLRLDFECEKLKDELSMKQSVLLEKKNQIQRSTLSDNMDIEYKILIKDREIQVNNIQSQISALEGSKIFLESYKKKINCLNSLCPICLRNFNEKNDEIKMAIGNIDSTLESIPNEIQTKNSELQIFRKELNLYRECEPIFEDIVNLKANEIPKIELEINDYDKKISDCKSKDLELSNYITSLKNKLKFLQKFNVDSINFDHNLKEIESLNIKISEYKIDITNLTEILSLKSMNETLLKYRKSLDELQNEKFALEDQLSTGRSQISDLTHDINSETSKYLNIRNKLDKKNCSDKLDEIEIELKRNKEKLEKSQKYLTDIDHEINSVKSSHENLTLKLDSLQEQYLERINKLQLYGKEVESIVDKIEEINDNLQDSSMTECFNRKQMIDMKINETNEKIIDVEEEKNSLRSKISNSESYHRKLLDAKILRENIIKLENLSKRLNELESNLEDYHSCDFETERQSLIDRINEINKIKSEFHSSLHSNEGKLSHIESELSEMNIKHANRNFLKHYIVLELEKKILSDIECSIKALDQSILQYHSSKMEELNRIIKDLWRLTYMGTDIESIQIKVEDDNLPDSNSSKNPLSKPGASKSLRKSYSYRVTMIKGGIEMDMRSRCSTGQKVLAALIIRLALAEAFCFQCGILALDEPTTNLDKDNISSLASSLIKLVNERYENGASFQLIIITHDEDFIKTLGDSEFTDSIIKVQRDDKGLSNISQITLDDLEMNQFE